ncbi:AHH domain-containing protein [Orientia tsutsugamushi]|uniref:AHH domain-containing protein n=1 Tax=Orientia tsutsugamushi TaxID=784 RepID=UPI000D5A36FF|nr:Uncharacterised protein [Orientia tsutsugamushi]
MEKQHKDLINSIVASISVEEVLKEAVANYNSASPDGELIATLVKTQENLIAKILIADPSTNKNSAIANDNSATPSNDQQHLVTWKGNKIPVTKLELWMSWSLDKIGAGDIARRYFDILARINQIGESDVISLADIIKQTPLELLLNSNIGAIFLEVSGRCLIWTTKQLDQITAQYFPKTRAFIETAVSLTVDKAVSLTKAMLEQLPEPARSVFINSVLAVYEKSKTLYLNLTEDLYEGQKALVDFTLGCAVGEVVGRGLGGVVKGAVGGTKGAIEALKKTNRGTTLTSEVVNTANTLEVAALNNKANITGTTLTSKVEKIVHVDQKLLSVAKVAKVAKDDGITGAAIFKTEGNKFAAILNVKKDFGKPMANLNISNKKMCLLEQEQTLPKLPKDFGKTIANKNIPNERISLNNISQKTYQTLKEKFRDEDLQLLIQKSKQNQIFIPKTHYVVANLPEGTSVVTFVSYGSNRGIKIGSKLGTQTHHLIPQQFLKEEIFNFCGIDIKNDVLNKMILYTPEGLELATKSSNIVRDTYAKMLKQLNPSLTQKEIQIISELKVPLPNKQRSTHFGRHDNSYVLPIKEKLDKLWDDVKLGKLNKEECRKAIYDLMRELREGIRNGSTKLNIKGTKLNIKVLNNNIRI